MKKISDKKGSALALTMFILAGMLMIALSGSYVILIGIKAAGVQSQSTRAYYAAESGAENVLYLLRKTGWTRPDPSAGIVYSSTLPSGGGYDVYYTHFLTPMIFRSVGSFNQTKRSVELRM